MSEKSQPENEGEGNRSADERYRKGVRETVEELDLDSDGQANDDETDRTD